MYIYRYIYIPLVRVLPEHDTKIMTEWGHVGQTSSGIRKSYSQKHDDFIVINNHISIIIPQLLLKFPVSILGCRQI